MQAFKTEKTDLSQEAYLCQGCGHAFLGRPREEACAGYFDPETGEWIEDDYRFTIAWICHDDEPCEPVLTKEDSFNEGTLADLYRQFGMRYYTDPETGQLLDILPSDIWSCGNCENKYLANDYGERNAQKLAVRCCQ